VSRPICKPENISENADSGEKPLPTTPDALIAVLEYLRIDYALHHHKPLFTVADGLEIEAGIPGRHCRNLFVRDKREKMFLVSALNETRIDLKKLAPAVNADRFSFGSPERLWRHLGVRPGSVCPFAIINDTTKAVTPVLDAEMMAQDIINFHPLLNTMTVGLRPAGLLAFYAHIGREPVILDMGPIAPEEEE
jgi:Ala-tRNA(Pro) deacylase